MREIRISQLFNYVAWGIWIGVVVLNSLGVTQIPWNVAIVPMISTAIMMGLLVIGLLSNKDKLEEMTKELNKRKDSK